MAHVTAEQLFARCLQAADKSGFINLYQIDAWRMLNDLTDELDTPRVRGAALAGLKKKYRALELAHALEETPPDEEASTIVIRRVAT